MYPSLSHSPGIYYILRRDLLFRAFRNATQSQDQRSTSQGPLVFEGMLAASYLETRVLCCESSYHNCIHPAAVFKFLAVKFV